MSKFFEGYEKMIANLNEETLFAIANIFNRNI